MSSNSGTPPKSNFSLVSSKVLQGQKTREMFWRKCNQINLSIIRVAGVIRTWLKNHLLYFEVEKLTHSFLFGLNKISLLVEDNYSVSSLGKSHVAWSWEMWLEGCYDSILPLLVLLGTNVLSFSERTGGKSKLFSILHPRKDQTSLVPPRNQARTQGSHGISMSLLNSPPSVVSPILSHMCSDWTWRGRLFYHQEKVINQ